jgi:hypothetical protein
MQACNKKGLTKWFIHSESTYTYTISKHDHAPRLPTVIKGLKLTGVTPVGKTTNAQRHPTCSQTCTQVSHLLRTMNQTD